MNVALIRERLTEFRPFTVPTSSGHGLPVPQPDLLLLTARPVVGADRRGHGAVPDPQPVMALNDLPARQNGRAPRR